MQEGGEQDQGGQRRVGVGTPLDQRREDIDRKYEFSSSRLTQMLGILLCEGRITEAELRGLREDKVKPFLREGPI